MDGEDGDEEVGEGDDVSSKFSNASIRAEPVLSSQCTAFSPLKTDDRKKRKRKMKTHL